jgi:alkaline phosphatase D
LAPSRREFLRTSAACAAAAGLAPWLLRSAAGDLIGAARDEELGLFPVLQTMTHRSEAQFRVLVDTAKAYAYRGLRPDGEELELQVPDRFIHPSDPAHAVDHLMAEGLKPGEEYRLQIIEEATGNVLDERKFRSLDAGKDKPRVALISCMSDDFMAVQRDMWNSVRAAKPDILFFLGDAAYLDEQNTQLTEASLWRRHVATRMKLDVYRWKTLRPVLSIWDDHDYGINNGGFDFPLKTGSSQMFEALFGAQDVTGYASGLGRARVLSLFGQRFFLMDCRSWRRSGGAEATHWGGEQEDWFFEQLALNDEPAFLMNGSQFFGKYHGYESFEKQHPEQLKRVLERLGKAEAPVVLCSGDVHYSELMRLGREEMGYETFELTSSSLHSYYSQVFKAPNPRRLVATDRYNFLLLEPKTVRGGLEMKVRSIGRGSEQIFTRDLAVKR